MTEKEKVQIKNYRLQGLTYAEISEKLSLSVSTIKSFCSRNNITLHRCPQCGEMVLQTEHRKFKRFCSAKCRMTWWNRHPDQGKRMPHHTQVCPVCHKTFDCYHSKQRNYCSRKCYALSRTRTKGETQWLR